MITLYQVIQARRMLSKAGFPDPGFLSSAAYTLFETIEVAELVHLDMRPGDMRARDKSVRDGIDKELGQVVFMAYTTLAHCGSVMVEVEFDRREPKYSDFVISLQMSKDAMDALQAANKGNTREVKNHMTEVIAWAYLLGRRYNVDLEKAMWAWVAERKEEAEKRGTGN